MGREGWVSGVVAVCILMLGVQGSASSEAIGEAAEGAPLRISMEFQDANLKDVLKTLSRETGINVIAGADVGDQPITLYLEEVTFMDALDQILRAGNLTYERQPGSEIYIVKSKKDAGPSTITRVYRLKYGRVSRSILARAADILGRRTPFETALGIGTSGSTSGSTSGATAGLGSTAGAGSLGRGLGGAEDEDDDIGIDAIIRELVTPKVGSVVVDGRTNALIVTDVAENFPRIEAALAALDIRTPQIMVDAELIETTLTKLKDLGFEWGKDPEGDLISFTLGSRKTRFPFGFLREGDAPTGATPFSAATLDATSFKGVLQALESDTDTKILARPKVLTLDNESAFIRLTADEAIGFETTTAVQTESTLSEPERTLTGVVLVVTPQVNEQGYITMLVEPSVTKTVASKLLTVPQGQTTPRDPKTRSARTMVRIRSGDTLVVGGLIDRSEEETLRRVPILSGIPFLGEAFKNTEVSNSASELIVFITPRILDEPTDAQLASSAAPTPLGLREQEPANARQETIEETLNTLEKR